jgi:glycerophosphoryl diester phosphodiesterase
MLLIKERNMNEILEKDVTWFMIPLSIIFVIWNVLFNYPNLLHKKKNIGKKGFSTIIAHRGSRSEGLPENTIAAYKDACKVPDIIVELDVYLTKCGEVVVHHDDTLTRMTIGGNNEKIHEVNKKDLPKIIPGNTHNLLTLDQISRLSSYEQIEWETIPTLEDVLKIIPESITLIVEFKQDSDELITKVRDLLYKYNRVNTKENNKLDSGNLFWFSLTDKINNKLKNKDTNILTINSVNGIMKTLLLYYTGLLLFFPIHDAVFGITLEEIPLTRINREPSLKNFPQWLKNIMAVIFKGKPPDIFNCPKLFTYLRKRYYKRNIIFIFFFI